MWARIKKHPRLGVVSTIVLAVTAYFVLPIIGVTVLSVAIAITVCAIVGPALGGFLGWVGQKIGLIKRDPIRSISLPARDKKLEGIEKISSVLLQHIVAPNLKAEELIAMMRVSDTHIT